MPHYKNGQEAKVGDRLRFKATTHDPVAGGYRGVMRDGIVMSVHPGPATCNAQVAFLSTRSGTGADGKPAFAFPCVDVTYVTLGECEKVEYVD